MAKMSADQKDAQVDNLLRIVAQQKAEIARSERPKWETNCSFGYNEDSNAGRINLQVTSNVDELTKALAFLIEKERAYSAAADILGQSDATFKWMGYTLGQWQSDFLTRVGKIQIAAKRKKLELAEEALGKLISKERREELELERLTKELGA
jgi:hypothetical protein